MRWCPRRAAGCARSSPAFTRATRSTADGDRHLGRRRDVGRAADARLGRPAGHGLACLRRRRASAGRSRTTACRSRSGATRRQARRLPRRHQQHRPGRPLRRPVSHGRASPNAATDSVTRAGRDRVERPRRGPHARPVDRPGRRATMNTPGGQAPDALERVGMTGRDGARHLRRLPARHECLHQQDRPSGASGPRNPMVLSAKGRALPGRRARPPTGACGRSGSLQRSNYADLRRAQQQGGHAVRRDRQAQAARRAPTACPASRARGPRRAATLDLAGARQTRDGDDIANYHQRDPAGHHAAGEAARRRRGPVHDARCRRPARHDDHVRRQDQADRPGRQGRHLGRARQEVHGHGDEDRVPARRRAA